MKDLLRYKRGGNYLKEVLLGNEVRPDLVNEQGLSLIGWSDLLKSHN